MPNAMTPPATCKACRKANTTTIPTSTVTGFESCLLDHLNHRDDLDHEEHQCGAQAGKKQYCGLGEVVSSHCSGGEV